MQPILSFLAISVVYFAYLEGELDQTKTSLRETQGQIQGMKDKVAEAHATMERVVREHRELNEKL